MLGRDQPDGRFPADRRAYGIGRERRARSVSPIKLVGATHSSEATDTGIVWHFAVNGQDYARYVITIADRPGGSRVSASFETVDGPGNSAIPFLRDSDKAASDEALLAALEHRPVNIANFQKALVINTVRDPTKITGLQRAIVAELDNAMQDVGSGQARDTHHAYDETQAYDRTPAYDRGHVTQYEAERRREEVRREYGIALTSPSVRRGSFRRSRRVFRGSC